MISRNLLILLGTNSKKFIKNYKLGLILIALKRLPIIIKKNNFYSQFGEDVKLKKYLSGEKGFYLDIGSGDPVKGSNTFNLYKSGWRGILVDPLYNNIFLSKLIRWRDKSIRGFIGDVKSEIVFYELNPYEYSTAIESRALELIVNNKATLLKKSLQVCILISELGIKLDDNRPSLLSIDCEGYDYEILKTIDLNEYKFSIVIVEDFFNDKSVSKIHNLLRNNQYELVERASPSSIYVRSSYLDKIS
jgi:hypothetical protein